MHKVAGERLTSHRRLHGEEAQVSWKKGREGAGRAERRLETGRPGASAGPLGSDF